MLSSHLMINYNNWYMWALRKLESAMRNDSIHFMIVNWVQYHQCSKVRVVVTEQLTHCYY